SVRTLLEGRARMRRKRNLGVTVLAGAALLIGAAPGRAQTINDRVTALEKQAQDTRASLASALGIDFHAMVDTRWIYSFNDPDDAWLNTGVFDPEHNDIDLPHFNLRISREKEDEPIGFVANLDFGRVARVVGSVTCWSHGCNDSENDNSFEAR